MLNTVISWISFREVSSRVDYRIERLSLQNIGSLVPLYRLAFGQMISTEFLRRKYDTRNFGAEFIGFMAFNKMHAAVAYYGVIPCHFILAGETILAAQSADTMTHPAYRKKGLFSLLAERTYVLAREKGIKFIYGFPNQKSWPGFVKLGWHFEDDKLQLFSVATGGIPYARLLKPGSILSLIYKMIRTNSGPNPTREILFPENNSNGVKHDDHFMSYKTYHETMMLDIKGVRVWVRADGKLKVGAVQGMPGLNAIDFIAGIKSAATSYGCNEVIFMTSKHSALYKYLGGALAPRDAFPVGYFMLDNEIRLQQPMFEYCDVDIF